MFSTVPLLFKSEKAVDICRTKNPGIHFFSPQSHLLHLPMQDLLSALLATSPEAVVQHDEHTLSTKQLSILTTAYLPPLAHLD